MSEHYRDYIVNTGDVNRTKQEVREKLHEAAGVLLVVSDHHHGKTSTQNVTFLPQEVHESGFVFSRGVITPQNTEASIKSEDHDHYLVLVADLNPDDTIED
jgi:hypothetical protein